MGKSAHHATQPVRRQQDSSDSARPLGSLLSTSASIDAALPLGEALRLLQESGVEHALPVSRGGWVVGYLSAADLEAAVLALDEDGLQPADETPVGDVAMRWTRAIVWAD